MNKIEVGTIVFYVHRENERPNGSYVSPAIVTRPWSQDGSLNITVIPDCGTPFTKSSSIHAVSLNDMAMGDRWISKEECDLLRIDLSNPYLNPAKLVVDRTAMREENPTSGNVWLNPLTFEEAKFPVANGPTERLPEKDQTDPGD